MSIQNTTRGSLCGPCPTTNYAYMFPRKNYRFVGKIKVIASPEAKAPLCLWLEAPGEELSSFWTTVTEPSPSHKRTNNQFVNTAVKSWLNLEINWLIMFHFILRIMLICDLLSLTTMSTYTTIEHVEAVYDRDWTPGFVIIVIFCSK